MAGWVTTAGGIVLLVAAVGALLRKVVIGMIRTMRRIGHVLDEVLGDGDKRPGWGYRLTTMEKDMVALKATGSATLAEVKPNGGSSLKDQIGRIERATGATQEDPAE